MYLVACCTIKVWVVRRLIERNLEFNLLDILQCKYVTYSLKEEGYCNIVFREIMMQES